MFSARIKDVIYQTEDSRFSDVSFFLQATVCGDKIFLEIRGEKEDGETVFEEALSRLYRVFPIILQVSFPVDARSIEEIADAQYAEVIASCGRIIVGADKIKFEVGDEYSSCLCTEDEAGEDADDQYLYQVYGQAAEAMVREFEFCIKEEESAD